MKINKISLEIVRKSMEIQQNLCKSIKLRWKAMGKSMEIYTNQQKINKNLEIQLKNNENQ